MRQRIFVGSSREALEIGRALQAELDDEFDVTVWNQGVFSLSRGALDPLLEVLGSSDAGVFVLRPDDLTKRRGVEEATVRDNVIFELGMFIGRLSPSRTFMLTPAGATLHPPSDLLGVTTANYDSRRADAQETRAAVGPACTQIRTQLRAQQVSPVAEPAARARLDRAMTRLSRDLQSLLTPVALHRRAAERNFVHVQTTMERAVVTIESGRIENYDGLDDVTV